MEIPDIMISDAIKKLAGYKFNMSKKVESENAKKIYKQEEQHVSPVKSGKGKWFMCYGDHHAVAGEGLSVAHKKYYDSSYTNSDAIFYSLSLDKTKESANETEDADESDMDLSDNNPDRDDDAASHPVYTDAQTTSVVHNPEGNPELTSYISGASKVPLGTHVDVLATKTLLQEMFPDKNAHHLSSPPATKTSYPTTHP
ncbi:hypothetical protein Tco_0663218 [Tanacetum coccineum]